MAQLAINGGEPVRAKNDFFPALLTNNAVSAFFYILPLPCVVVLLSRLTKYMRVAIGIMLLSSAVMNLHLNTYNDATFVVSFWVALWMWWLAGAMRKIIGAPLASRARLLAQWIVAMTFLGGMVGKLTPEYTSGEVVYHIFYVQTKVSFLTFLIEGVPLLTEEQIFGLISKFMIGGEFLLAINFLFPFMVAFYLSAFLIPMLMFFSTWRILSVIGPLLGLLMGSHYIKRQAAVDE